jgi:hypothetical protein
MSAVGYRSGRSIRIAQKLLRQSHKAQTVTTGDFKRKTEEMLGSTDASRLESELNRRGFHFLNYAKEFWALHLKNLDQNADRQMWNLFCKCVEGRNVTADRPWITSKRENLELKAFPKEIQWCMVNKHHALLLYTTILNIGVLTEDEKIALLNCAIIHDQIDLVETIAHRSPETLSKVLPDYAGDGHVGIVIMLLMAGADVNAAAGYSGGRTALRAAAEGGHLEVVEKLLAAGAHVDTRTGNDGLTALEAAEALDQLDVVKRLQRALFFDNTLGELFPCS